PYIPELDPNEQEDDRRRGTGGWDGRGGRSRGGAEPASPRDVPPFWRQVRRRSAHILLPVPPVV
ncbi:MAG: hypothetical protein U9R68_03810, partial [Planctomycetota bacterium]|nr:hypothetical protein [Planctomycetota bacterium]